MKPLILDYSKWRCGGDSKNRLGEGTTALLNKEGYMCCLGQFSLQLAPLSKKDILNKPYPQDTYKYIPFLTKDLGEAGIVKTSLVPGAVTINDKSDLSPKERIKRLKELFSGYGLEIKVINHNIFSKFASWIRRHILHQTSILDIPMSLSSTEGPSPQ